jgi:hypothetical protein
MSKVQYFFIKHKTKNLLILKWDKYLSKKSLLSKGFEIILRWMEIEKIQLQIPNLFVQGIFPT